MTVVIVRWEGSISAENSICGKCQARRPSGLICMDVDRSHPNPKLSGVRSALIHRTHGITATRDGTTASRRLPSAPSFEVAETCRGDSITRQCTLVGDSLNDEQRSDHLSNPSSYQPTCPKIGVTGKHEPESRRGWGRRCP